MSSSRSSGVLGVRRGACICRPFQGPIRWACGWRSRGVELDVDLLPQAVKDLALLAGVVALAGRRSGARGGCSWTRWWLGRFLVGA